MLTEEELEMIAKDYVPGLGSDIFLGDGYNPFEVVVPENRRVKATNSVSVYRDLESEWNSAKWKKILGQLAKCKTWDALVKVKMFELSVAQKLLVNGSRTCCFLLISCVQVQNHLCHGTFIYVSHAIVSK